ncbi:MAG: hypothetical protein NDJ90_14455 [Oligoflexia bacterium]|nr:hypothetical protein [Oligoflexia bacterium]
MRRASRVVISLFLLSYPLSSHAVPLGGSFSAGLPHPLNLALEARVSETFSGSISLGGLPTVHQQEVALSLSTLNARGRWHPFSGAFFLGGILGAQKIKGSMTEDVVLTSPSVVIPTTVSLAVNNLYLTPHLGWLWGLNAPGLLFGVEAGVQLPFGARSSLEIRPEDPAYLLLLPLIQATPEYQKAESDVETAANRVGKLVFPYVAIRLGWLF